MISAHVTDNIIRAGQAGGVNDTAIAVNRENVEIVVLTA